MYREKGRTQANKTERKKKERNEKEREVRTIYILHPLPFYQIVELKKVLFRTIAGTNIEVNLRDYNAKNKLQKIKCNIG